MNENLPTGRKHWPLLVRIPVCMIDGLTVKSELRYCRLSQEVLGSQAQEKPAEHSTQWSFMPSNLSELVCLFVLRWVLPMVLGCLLTPRLK
jgi:hypothetical protein